MNFMLLFRLRIDLDVVNEDDDKLVKIWLTYVVHKNHEYCRSISQTERHDRELKMYLIEQVIDPGKRVAVLDSQLVQFSIMSTHTE
ncbi:hypothetical protein Tco_0618379 [Tanacetum coccineum]